LQRSRAQPIHGDGSGFRTARFPLDRPIPASLVRKIVKLRVAENRLALTASGAQL